MSQEPNITLYTTQTPNGIKISITLEELGLPYKTHKVEISKNTQKEDWFLASKLNFIVIISGCPIADNNRPYMTCDIEVLLTKLSPSVNPNGRIPAITDAFSDGQTINIWESGSIMQYLVDRYDTNHKISYPRGSREWFETNNWLFFQNAGVGPMQGQANHFTRYAPEKIEYGVNRYQNETRRLYSVLDKHLASDNKPYLVGEKCTIADIAHYGWVSSAGWAGVDIDDYPALKAWEDRMTARPGVEKGRHVPDPYTIKELMKDKEAMEKQAAESRKWVQAQMKQDAEKAGK